MIAVDTNVLVHAHREDSEFHERAAQVVRDLAEGRARWAIPWPCIHEFLAIVTHPRIFQPPTKLRAGIDQVDAWLESPSVVLLSDAIDHWEQLRALLLASRVTGPRVHDGRVVAICRSHGVRELWSADRDFNRFAGLRVVNPLI